MADMQIEIFAEQYRQALIALWTECGLVVPQNDPNKDIDRKLQVGADLFLLGVLDGEVVASVMGGYEGHRGWINYLAVKPSHQRKGYGQAMMAAVETRLREKGCPKINLQVRSTNTAVIAFYDALGYGNDNVVGLGKRLELDR
ncbi:GNAT family acetyltransferase [Marinobacterium stanieri]|uniref:Acetyltransferase (GNAT) family protein n=1 Tax=Marinobacterium stanieri TaxID=49186 RepID=A0A1N6VQ20_9GAMM|nr:GNAT family acetyltransferase [Marinobacterium stanieri]SIQ79909.1 Acetyltransferase (GNAT) family protein [Marinobacterium stanieri]